MSLPSSTPPRRGQEDQRHARHGPGARRPRGPSRRAHPDVVRMTGDGPTRVLVVGATGSIGRLVVAAAARHGLSVRALVRDGARARRLLPDAELVPGDLTDPDTVTAAVHDVDAVVFTHGSAGGAYADVDYGGVAGVLRALGDRRARVVL